MPPTMGPPWPRGLLPSVPPMLGSDVTIFSFGDKKSSCTVDCNELSPGGPRLRPPPPPAGWKASASLGCRSASRPTTDSEPASPRRAPPTTGPGATSPPCLRSRPCSQIGLLPPPMTPSPASPPRPWPPAPLPRAPVMYSSDSVSTSSPSPQSSKSSSRRRVGVAISPAV